MQQLGQRECGTFRFRLAEALDRLPELAARYSQPADYSPRTGDYRLLFDCFSLPTLAERLFLLFEHMRIQGHLLRSYPGLARHLTAFQTPTTATVRDQNRSIGYGRGLVVGRGP